MNYGRYLPYHSREAIMSLELEVDRLLDSWDLVEFQIDLTYSQKHELFDLFLKDKAATVSNLQDEVEGLEEEVQTLEARIEERSDDISELKSDIEELEASIKGFKQDRNDALLATGEAVIKAKRLEDLVRATEQAGVAKLDALRAKHNLEKIGQGKDEYPNPLTSWVFWGFWIFAGYFVADILGIIDAVFKL